MIAGVVTVVFGTLRVAAVQYRQAQAEDDSIKAYWAAQAGIETGLRAYRDNRNAETDKDKVIRFDMDSGQIVKQNPNDTSNEISRSSTSGLVPGHQVFDLAMSYKTTKVGDFNASDSLDQNNNPVLNKDVDLTVTGFSPSADTYHLRYKMWFVSSGNSRQACSDTKAFVQLESISNGAVYAQRTINKTTADPFDSATQSPSNEPIFINGVSLVNTLRLTPYYCSVKYALETVEDATGSASANVLFDPGATNNPDNQNAKTVVLSTGYYGDAKRALIAEINRSSGKLIRIFEFNLYAGEGKISP